MPTSRLMPPPELAPRGIDREASMAAEGVLATLRENPADIEFDRLPRTIEAEVLGPVYREIWRDAFPDEPLPDCL